MQTQTSAAPIAEPELQWSSHDQTRAFAAGWGLFDVDSNPNQTEIQRLDEAMLFRTDDEAIVHVLRRARDHENGTLEQRAIAYVKANNREFYDDVILDIAKRMGL